ncbi:MAG: hypothetical protein LBP87_04150 [Planctomycetaceae bacterium]|jgi:hypothetical protein|nr:hypothetical protein [Planctomycetaceae bacterium]
MISAKLQPKINKIQDLRRRSNWKKAYKEASFLSRLHNEPELQELLVFSLWEWIKEQFNRNQYEEAKTNIKELLRLIKNPNINSLEIQKEFPPIFRVLGLNEFLPEHLRQDMNSSEIQTELVDRFLVHGENSNDLSSDFRNQAILIQKALEKVEAKLDNEALELLHPISFHSPLSEWRLFVRGLISYYNKNDEKADESWKRLSELRPPYRIVARLRKFFTDVSNTSSSNFVSPFFDLFRTKNDSALIKKIEFLNHIRQLNNYIRQKKFKELVGHFQACRSFLQNTDQLLFERVFRTVHFTLINDAKPEIVRQFIERNIPLPLDPRGNRTFGLIALSGEQEDYPRWLQEPYYYWELFAEQDIDQIKSFTPSVKNRAKAVIYTFLGNALMQEIFSRRKRSRFASRANDFDIKEQEKILQYFDKALANDPTYLVTYWRLQEFYRNNISEHEDNLYHPKIAEVYRKLIEHVPNNTEALKYLFQYNAALKNYADARAYFERLQVLEPLSRETLFLKRKLQYIRLKELLLSDQKSSEIEQLFNEIENTNLNTIEYNYDLVPLALRYIYAIISNRPAEADEVFKLAEKIGLEKRVPLILAIFSEVGNFPQFPKQILESLEHEWFSIRIGQCNGNVAGALGNIAYAIMAERKKFPNAKKIIKDVFQFVNRSKNVKWKTEKDLYGACKILWYLAIKLKKKKYVLTYKKLVRKGLSQFPLSPYFLFFDAEISFLQPDFFQEWYQDSITAKYQLFIERCNRFRNDPVLDFYLNETKLRFDELDSIAPFEYDFDELLNKNKNKDDDDDDDFDDDDNSDNDEKNELPYSKSSSKSSSSSRNVQSRIEVPPELSEISEIMVNEEFSPRDRQGLIDSLPKEFGHFRPLIIDALLKCVMLGIPLDQLGNCLREEAKGLPFLEKMQFLSIIKEMEDADIFEGCNSLLNVVKPAKKKKKKR